MPSGATATPRPHPAARDSQFCMTRATNEPAIARHGSGSACQPSGVGLNQSEVLPKGYALRELRREDASAVHALKVRNRDRLTRHRDWTIPDDYAVADVEVELESSEYPKRSFGIRHGDDLVGVVSLTAVTQDSWSIGYFLDADSTGRGVASAACAAVLPLAQESGAREIYGVVTRGNDASDAVLKRAGFHLLQTTPRSTRWWLPLTLDPTPPTMQLFAARSGMWRDETGEERAVDVVTVDFDHEVTDDLLHPVLDATGTVQSSAPTYYVRLDGAGASLTPCQVQSPGHHEVEAAMGAAEKALTVPVTWTSSG